jgi:hypothetical protein
MHHSNVFLVTFLFNRRPYWEVVTRVKPETKEDFLSLLQEGIMKGSVPSNIGTWYKQLVKNGWKTLPGGTLEVQLTHPYGHPSHVFRARSKELLQIN